MFTAMSPKIAKTCLRKLAAGDWQKALLSPVRLTGVSHAVGRVDARGFKRREQVVVGVKRQDAAEEVVLHPVWGSSEQPENRRSACNRGNGCCVNIAYEKCRYTCTHAGHLVGKHARGHCARAVLVVLVRPEGVCKVTTECLTEQQKYHTSCLGLLAAATPRMGAALTVGAGEGRPLGVQARGQAADGGGGVLGAAAGGGVAAGAIVCSTTC